MRGGVDAATLGRRISALEQMDLASLRSEWIRVVGTNPHLRLSADLLRRGVAHRQQEAAYGSCPPATLRLLAAAARQTSSSQPAGSALKPGTTLIREWHSRTYTVCALDDGFLYDGRHFASLTVIAREITGAAWSGPRFFGVTASAAFRRRVEGQDAQPTG